MGVMLTDAAAERVTGKESELIDLEDELADAISDISEKYTAISDSIEPLAIGLEKTDIKVAELKLIWVPAS